MFFFDKCKWRKNYNFFACTWTYYTNPHGTRKVYLNDDDDNGSNDDE